MKRSILISLMIIGAVSAMISGATFSAFTDDETATGSLTTGNVNVAPLTPAVMTWSPAESADCEEPLGSDAECESTVTVNYEGNLDATLKLELEYTESSDCFDVAMAWSGGGSSSAGNPIVIDGLTAADGTVTVTVSVASSADSCQSATISLTLTVTATEVTEA